MVYLVNAPEAFTEEFVAGFAAAHPLEVTRVPGGLIRTTGTDGAVAVVTGGGTGHFPAFAGLVRPGMAAAAVIGNVFASPSAAQVESVAREAALGGGVILVFGNYAGDVLNFSQGRERLIAAGIPCEIVTVTDDISSAPRGSEDRRRGVAGDLVVLAVAGAAADEGRELAEVVRVARAANDTTRTLGVAFGGCSLPGADEPLFTVPDGRMAVGLGIHGEPGVGEVDAPTAADLAALLVESLAADKPEAAGDRVVAILNGLGSVKYEELYVLFGSIAERVAARGWQLIDARVGEFCTSFDMAGLSLTLFWPDAELERLWRDSDSTATRAVGSPRRAAAPGAVAASVGYRSSDASRSAARRLAPIADDWRDVGASRSDEWGRIDAVAGDGDHGIGMLRGLTAAATEYRRAVSDGAGLGSALRTAGGAWADAAGGTSGALWSTMLTTAADRLGDDVAPTAQDVADAVEAAVQAVRQQGGAAPGDKTMVDALLPFAAALGARTAEGAGLESAWTAAAAAAVSAAAETSELVARTGRARTHGERSIGTPDAGATSFAALVSVEVSTDEGEEA